MATEVGTAVHQALQDATEAGDRHAATKALIKRYPYELWLTATNKERASRSLLSCAGFGSTLDVGAGVVVCSTFGALWL